MRLYAPEHVNRIIAVIPGLPGILGTLTDIPLATEFNYWFIVAGWLLLVLATITKGLYLKKEQTPYVFHRVIWLQA